MQVAFFGTPELAEVVLVALEKALAERGGKIAQIWTRPPVARDRGKRVQASPVSLWAQERGYAVREPEQLGGKEAEFLRAIDLAIVFAYGEKLPQEVLVAPKFGCINLHPSLLPRWRGATPCNAAILAGDKTSGWSWIRMTEEMDAGPILMQSESAIGGQETAEDLETRLVAEATTALPALMDGLANNTLEACEQDSTHATYAPKLTREAGLLDWRTSAEDLARRVRALAPWPGTWCPLAVPTESSERLKVLEVRASDKPQESKAIGSVLRGEKAEDALQVACGEGGTERLILLRVQRQGRKPMTGAELQRGFALPEQLPVP